MNDYLTVRDSKLTFEINRSKFIAYVIFVENQEDAQQKIMRLKAQYRDATHVCYAYLIDSGCMRFDDDNEPAGTAGRPILEVIKNSGLSKTLIAVVRYFGGIKLGAAGLLRAYSNCASEALKSCKKVLMRYCYVYDFDCGFDVYNKILAIINLNPFCKSVKVMYNDIVSISCAFLNVISDLQVKELENLGAKLTDVNQKYIEDEGYGNGN